MKKPIIAFPEFDKLDIRVGEVKESSMVEGSKNLIKLQVDLGEDYGVVTILSGLAKWYSPEQIQGNKYAFLANLEPKQMVGLSSNGMVLVVDDETKPILLQVDNTLKNGLIIR